MSAAPFTHLHLASGYSFKYGTTLPEKIVEGAANFGMDAVALTDRDGLAGAIRFARSCIDYSIAPIIGVDFQFEENSRITLLATPGDGWRSLDDLSQQQKNCQHRYQFNSWRRTPNSPRIFLPFMAPTL